MYNIKCCVFGIHNTMYYGVKCTSALYLVGSNPILCQDANLIPHYTKKSCTNFFGKLPAFSISELNKNDTSAS